MRTSAACAFLREYSKDGTGEVFVALGIDHFENHLIEHELLTSASVDVAARSPLS